MRITSQQMFCVLLVAIAGGFHLLIFTLLACLITPTGPGIVSTAGWLWGRGQKRETKLMFQT